MNLTDMMTEASIIDHSWAEKPGGMTTGDEPLIDVESLKKHNNIKPELEIQWGGGGPEIDIDEPAGVVQRNLGKDSPDADSVIVFARDMMNRGFMGRDLNRLLRSRFSVSTLKLASKELSEQLKLEGIAGCIAVDGRGYRSCKDALSAAQHSPYKRFIKYVIGCQCGTPRSTPKAPRGDFLGAASPNGSGSAVDDFLADSRIHQAETVAVCRSTALPFLGQENLDPSEVESGLIDLMTVTKLPEEKAREFQKQGGIRALQSAFKWVQGERESSSDRRYQDVVDISEHLIDASDPVVEIAGLPPKPIDISLASPSKISLVAIDKPGPSTRLDAMSLGSEIVIELEKEAKVALAVNPHGQLGDIDLAKKAEAEDDVDMQPHLAGTFAGTDKIDLEAKRVYAGSLDVQF